MNIAFIRTGPEFLASTISPEMNGPSDRICEDRTDVKKFKNFKKSV